MLLVLFKTIDMMKIFGIFFLATIVKAQVIFPDEEPTGVQDPDDTELFDALEINTRQNTNSFGPSSCVTPNGETGRCQSFASCSAYASMRQNLHRPTVLNFLRARICRQLRRTVHLCCPTPTVKPPATDFLPTTTSLSQQECGSTPLANRIVGGKVTEPGEWPWMAAIGEKRGNSFSAGCGGTLITRRHVLSAGHCFAPGQVHPTMVRLGAYDLTRSSTQVAPQDFNIKDRRDGGYNRRTQENDIIILILDREANLNDYVQIACLPFNYRNENFLGEDLVVTGWGRTSYGNPISSDVPLKALVPVKDIASCANDYLKLEKNQQPVIDGRTLCAGNGSTDSCRGDSGGPLHYLNLDAGKYYVVGIVSFGVGCAKAEYPGVYTRVTSFLDWIERNTQ